MIRQRWTIFDSPIILVYIVHCLLAFQASNNEIEHVVVAPIHDWKIVPQFVVAAYYAILTITLEQMFMSESTNDSCLNDTINDEYLCAKLHIVDLVGLERAKRTRSDEWWHVLTLYSH